LINTIKPGTIKRIDKGSTRFHMATNVGFALAGARALGCTVVNIGPIDVIEGNVRHVVCVLRVCVCANYY
jgi:hypothetical protein